MANINKYTDTGGPQVLRYPNNRTEWAYKGSVSKPLSPTRFNIKDIKSEKQKQGKARRLGKA